VTLTTVLLEHRHRGDLAYMRWQVGVPGNRRRAATMVINNPGDSVANYSFCVNDFTFIDASGEEVPLPAYVAPDAGVAEPGPEVDLPAEAGTDAGLAVTLDAG
jgi:hypothetical protein